MRNETVYCIDCGKKLAWWDMYINLQYEAEWECLGELKKKVRNVFINPKTGTRVHSFTMDGGAGTILPPPEPGMKRIHYEMQSCSLLNKTKYCNGCARKRNYQCPICGGSIKLVRHSNGKGTKYTHGGW